MWHELQRELRPALTITRREIRDQFRDWRIIAPIVVLTIFFPGLMNFTARQAVNFVAKYGAEIVGDRLIPFLLMVVGFFPISISLVIALESFVGEKERRSIEPLLCTPLKDWQLYLGKLLASMAPPLLASYLGTFVYLIGVYRQVGWKPPLMLLAQILTLVIVQTIVMVSGAVVVSTQTTSARAANLLASFIIIPMALLIQAESVVMFWAQYNALWWIILGQLLLAGVLIRMGIAYFNREELLGRELDMIDLPGSARTFWRYFRGDARNPWMWLTREVPRTLRRLAVPMVLMSLILGGALLIGGGQAPRFPIPAEKLQAENLQDGSIQGLDVIPLFSASGVATVWMHNLRTMVLATLGGIFSFGILGVLVLMLPLMVIGYFLANMAVAGYSPLAFFAYFVLPHGIFEIPAIILTGAAVLQLGATLMTPSQGRTLGDAWLNALADWARIMVALVLPLLLAAATMEVFITPQAITWFFTH
ncbi:MAG: hypothetical protein D6755_09360 [Anaerolineae bacterium]|nr:MAG: hypothetical protein D6755_09360 [Anaerolineae bacterium]